MYGFFLIPFQSFSKLYLVAQKKKEYKAAKAKDKKPDTAGGKKNVSLFCEVKYYNREDLLALAGDRAVGNVLEQALVFLPLYWIHALFIDPTKSLQISLVYTITRAIYPFVFMANFKTIPGVLFISTVPGYVVTFYLFYQIGMDFGFGP